MDSLSRKIKVQKENHVNFEFTSLQEEWLKGLRRHRRRIQSKSIPMKAKSRFSLVFRSNNLQEFNQGYGITCDFQNVSECSRITED